MTEKTPKKSYEVSPTRAPFRFHAWLELPFPVSVQIDKKRKVIYREVQAELHINIRSAVYKVVTGNRWQYSREMEEWDARRTRSREVSDVPPYWFLDYVSQAGVEDVIDKVKDSNKTRYVHVEQVPAVVDLEIELPDALIPREAFVPYDLMPDHTFFVGQVLPFLQNIVDAYRIAARPWMRYSIMPVSEAIIDTTIMFLTDADGTRLGHVHFGFDPKSMSPSLISSTPELQAHFEESFANLDNLESEDQIASAYYLYRMRRWTEAVAVAYSVVEGLTKELVFRLASSEIEAKAVWRAYRYKELFNKFFPALGAQKLSEANPKLWSDFVRAREYRGARVHGSYSSPFDSDQRERVRRYLETFHDVARWLSHQMQRSWALDSEYNGEQLKPFP